MGGAVKIDFRVLFEKSPGLYLVLDRHFFILAVSDQYLEATRTRREDVVGQNLFDVFPEEVQDPNATTIRHLRSSLERVVRQREADAMAVQKFKLVRPDGTSQERYWSPTNTPILGADGEIEYIVHCVEDVTEFVVLKRGKEQSGRPADGESKRISEMETEIFKRSQELGKANQQLKDANDELALRTAELNDSLNSMQTFTYTMAHDLRSPLRALTSFSALVLDEYREKLDARGKDYLQRIDAAARKMDRLVTDLLAYGQLTHVEVTAIPVSLDDALTQVLHELGPEIRGRQAEIKVARPLPVVIGNVMLVKQVLVNLIDNALKFVPPERIPQIDITSHPSEKRIRLCVKDNGIGIEPQYHSRVFDLFARLHRSSEYVGTGVGLALVKKAMERMMGQVGIESFPSEGSCFWLEFRSAQ